MGNEVEVLPSRQGLLPDIGGQEADMCATWSEAPSEEKINVSGANRSVCVELDLYGLQEGKYSYRCFWSDGEMGTPVTTTASLNSEDEARQHCRCLDEIGSSPYAIKASPARTPAPRTWRCS